MSGYVFDDPALTTMRCCHSRKGDDLGVCHVPPPVEVGDVIELGHGPILLLRVVDLVETGPRSPLAARRSRR